MINKEEYIKLRRELKQQDDEMASHMKALNTLLEKALSRCASEAMEEVGDLIKIAYKMGELNVKLYTASPNYHRAKAVTRAKKEIERILLSDDEEYDKYNHDFIVNKRKDGQIYATCVVTLKDTGEVQYTGSAVQEEGEVNNIHLLKVKALDIAYGMFNELESPEPVVAEVGALIIHEGKVHEVTEEGEFTPTSDNASNYMIVDDSNVDYEEYLLFNKYLQEGDAL